MIDKSSAISLNRSWMDRTVLKFNLVALNHQKTNLFFLLTLTCWKCLSYLPTKCHRPYLTLLIDSWQQSSRNCCISKVLWKAHCNLKPTKAVSKLRPTVTFHFSVSMKLHQQFLPMHKNPKCATKSLCFTTAPEVTLPQQTNTCYGCWNHKQQTDCFTEQDIYIPNVFDRLLKRADEHSIQKTLGVFVW